MPTMTETKGGAAFEWRMAQNPPWSVRQAAAAAGVSPPTWTAYEADRSVKTLSAVKIERLISGRDPEPDSGRGERVAAEQADVIAELRELLPELREFLADRRDKSSDVGDGGGNDSVR